MKRFISTLAIASVAVLLLLGCGKGTGNRPCLSGDCPAGEMQSGVGEPVEEPSTGSGAIVASNLRCSATPSASLVYPAEIFTLTVTAAGGTAPYRIPSYIESFATTTALSGGYYNTTGSARLVQRDVPVYDATGNFTTCSFSVTVRSQTNPSNLACTVSVNPAAPKPGEIAEYTIETSGASRIDSFSFQAQPGWVATPSRVSDTSAKLSVIYNTPGTRQASAVVSAGNVQAACSTLVEVRQPRLELFTTPSQTSVTLNDPILVRAVGSGFNPAHALQYQFVSNEPGISVAVAGDTATVRATDGRQHAFDLVVRATNALGEIAPEQTVRLHFTGSTAGALACALQALPIRADGAIPFQVVALNSTLPNEVLEFTEFDAGPFATPMQAGLSNPMAFRFLPVGFVTVSARARSAVSGQECLNGARLTHFIRVRDRLNRCDVVTAPNPTLEGETAEVSVRIPAHVGVGPFRVSVTATGGEVSGGTGLGEARVRFAHHGSYPITVTATDEADGTQVHCGTTHNVRENIASRQISCSSSRYRYAECETGGDVRSVFVAVRHSHAGCSYGHSFGIVGSRIWVNHGCRATFEVRTRLRP